MSTYSLTIQRDTVAGSTSFLTNISNASVINAVFGEFSTDSTTVDFAFDKNTQRKTKIRVLTAGFGDGYEQRIRNGINSKEETFSVTFNNRSNEEIQVLSAFLDNKAGANFDITFNGETLKVTSEEYSTTYNQTSIHSLTTELRRVYEP
tara:strand:+ start:162 stop:608 length:447 start_codon:yes stop_codon:yes gene_type:complete